MLSPSVFVRDRITTSQNMNCFFLLIRVINARTDNSGREVGEIRTGGGYGDIPYSGQGNRVAGSSADTVGSLHNVTKNEFPNF